MTLIEVLVTMTIMLVVFAIFAGGLGLAIFGADVNNRQAAAASAIKTAAESVKSLPYNDSCTSISYELPPPPKAFQWVDPVVKFWDPTAGTFVAACPSGVDRGLQLITLKLTSSRPGPNAESGEQQVIATTLDVVKRDPDPAT